MKRNKAVINGLIIAYDNKYGESRGKLTAESVQVLHEKEPFCVGKRWRIHAILIFIYRTTYHNPNGS